MSNDHARSRGLRAFTTFVRFSSALGVTTLALGAVACVDGYEIPRPSMLPNGKFTGQNYETKIKTAGEYVDGKPAGTWTWTDESGKVVKSVEHPPAAELIAKRDKELAAAELAKPPASALPPCTREHMNGTRNIVNDAFRSGDFARIERMHADAVARRLRTDDGLWIAQAIQEGIDTMFPAYPDEIEKWIKRWQDAIPDSKLRPIVQAMHWKHLAWQARGTRYAAVTSDEAFQLFREKLAQAAQVLKASEATGKGSPLWYWMALNVAGATGMPKPAYDALFEEAVKRFPTYHTLYYSRVNYLLPQWGGDYQQVDAFVRKAVERTAVTDGEAFYAWIYLVVQRSVKDGGDYLDATAATWPRMKKGFEDMVSRYPETFNRNVYATMACRARDRETTARLLTELGDKARLGAGSNGITTEGCKRFAFDRV